MTTRNMAASVRARLLNKAKKDGMDFQLLLTRYALERLLYRLSISTEKDHFLLKGALLFDLWYDVPLRPTRDIDLLGYGSAEIPHLIAVFEGLCELEVDDGITFDVKSVKAEEIRKEANYSGTRLTLEGLLDGARCPVQVDVGFGDAVTPAPESAMYPVMFDDMPAPSLRVYPRYTVVAEKLEAIISLGMANSRMKDYFDLWVILRDANLEREILSQAVSATLNRRGTSKPKGFPVGLSEQFAADGQKTTQWTAFVQRNKLKAEPLSVTVQYLRDALNFIFLEADA
ncbi:MAG: nucleotidyl transferase AbiEii/AbiGii toxin family protein [Rhodoferax sp.]|nr:nucleotidyl transferase AbiEii/AbiGii toxin family protein [Rhodoferax sp.]